ncbi:substrate-binding periplasmic protein [Marinobacter sediminum]|uniref:substrate-binding periplasmic protein n=1 Tax=Marinobacter sediminum TaxID=256323 RepID=UPI003564E3D0
MKGSLIGSPHAIIKTIEIYATEANPVATIKGLEMGNASCGAPLKLIFNQGLRMIPRAFVASLFFLLTGEGLAQERTITFVADYWCPFNCSDHPKGRGLLVERAATALELEGYEVGYSEIPWSRAINDVGIGRYDAIVGAGPDETPNFHFPRKPLQTALHSAFTLPNKDWKYQGLESLEHVRIGVIQDYSYGGLYEDYIEGNRDDESRVVILRGNRSLGRLVKMLRLGRLDVIIAEKEVLNYHFQSRNQDNPLRYAGLVNSEPLYVAFSPAIKDGAELAKALERGLAKMNK